MAQAPTTATYTNDPTNVVLDRVRLLIGDTDCSTAYLTDAEIEHFLDEEDPDASGNGSAVLRAASSSADAIAAKLARRIDFTHGPVKKTASQLYEHYVDLAASLSRRASIEGVGPVVLGRTKAEKEAADTDDSLVQPDFKKGLTDNPRSGSIPLSPANETTDF